MGAQPKAGLDQLAEAATMVETTPERWAKAEMHRLRGTLLLSINKHASAADNYQHAIDVARRQSAKLWELRATTSLAHLWSAPKPSIYSRPSSAGSPKVPTRRSCRTPRRCSTSWRDPVSSSLLGVTWGDPRFCHAPSVVDVPRSIGDALSPRESSVSRNVSFVPQEVIPDPGLLPANLALGYRARRTEAAQCPASRHASLARFRVLMNKRDLASRSKLLRV